MARMPATPFSPAGCTCVGIGAHTAKTAFTACGPRRRGVFKGHVLAVRLAAIRVGNTDRRAAIATRTTTTAAAVTTCAAIFAEACFIMNI